jgi:7-carboxy-7-deazaguanine synthase
MISLDKFSQLRRDDVIKFVVGSEEDLLEAKRVIDYIRDKGCECWIYLSPVFGCIEPKRIVEFMQENNLQGKIKFQLQLHKMIWDPDRRGV